MLNFLIPLLIIGMLGDRFDDNGPALQSLLKMVTQEHAAVKEAVDCDTMTFCWKICSFGQFPIMKGQRMPYYENMDKYRSLDLINRSVYVVDDKTVYAGVRYWVQKPRIDVETVYFKVIEYHILNEFDKSFTWKRTADIITITCHLGVITDIVGRHEY